MCNQDLDGHLGGGFLRNHDFSGETKKVSGDLSFEFTLIMYDMEMLKNASLIPGKLSGKLSIIIRLLQN